MKKKYLYILLGVAILFAIVRAFAAPYHLSGDCMEPAFKDGQRYFLNQIAPYTRQYQLDDVILFKHEGKVWISRVVALETNTIQITDGSVVVNGVARSDGLVHRSWDNWRYGNYAIDNPLQIPAGHVYVLSDNLSAHHDDSRVFGPIATESILGTIW